MLRCSEFLLVVAPWQRLSCSASVVPLRSSHALLGEPAPARRVGSRGVLTILRVRRTSGDSPLPFSPFSCCPGPFKKLGIGQQQQQQQLYRRSQPSQEKLCIARSFYPSWAVPISSGSFRSNSAPSAPDGMTSMERQRRGKRRSGGLRAVAGAESLETDVPSSESALYEELQRYGVDESDYHCAAAVPSIPQQQRQRHWQPELPLGSKKQRTAAKVEELRKAAEAQLAGGGGGEVRRQLPTLRQESGVVEDWCAYLLLSADLKKTYVGVTYDIRRRLRQHNGEIAGGAKSARAGRPWRLVCTVRGFASRSEACQFEWTWKSTAAKIKSIAVSGSEARESPLVTRRRATLAKVLDSKDEWSSLECQWHSE